jgi:4-hydroxy-4-methyl-2-oxoglutarate aldolase
MIDYAAFQSLSPTTLADVLTRDRVMDIGIRPLWPGMPRVAGASYTVRCAPGDNLMLHAAIYRAAPGSIIVVEAGDVDYAVAGGNVCAVAQKYGIAAFIVDGLIRDLVEARKIRFPVFARRESHSRRRKCHRHAQQRACALRWGRGRAKRCGGRG